MTYVWSEQHASVGYTKLKDEQLRTVRDVLSGLDTFVVYRRDMASRCVTPFYRGVLLLNTKKASIVSVVSTLVSLTTNQVRAYILT